MGHILNWDRLLENETEEYRYSSEKDYDRIIFSQAFRRLAHKTQVHPLAQNDHVHNRMTHSIEVASVCRSLVAMLIYTELLPSEVRSCAISTIMAAGLGHDMGNPPFGHIGEESIRKWIKTNAADLENLGVDKEVISSYSSFDGNAQNFHIFHTYEYFKIKHISNPTISTMVKYPIVASESAEKSGYFSVEEKTFETCFKNIGLYNNGKFIRHPLSFLLEAADDICYAIMDIDDAIEMNFLQTGGSKFQKITKDLLGHAPKKNYKDYRTNRGETIDRAVLEVSKVFATNYKKIMNGDIENGMDLLKMPSLNPTPTIASIKDLKTLASEEVFRHKRKVQYETASYSILHRIFDNWLIAFKEYKDKNWKIDKCDTHAQKIFQMLDMYDPKTKLRPKLKTEGFVEVIDYVSGCTDRYANEISLAFLGKIE